MKKVLIINGAQKFAHSGGNLNSVIVDWDEAFFQEKGLEIEVTHVTEAYTPELEVEKIVAADFIIYHFPIWWMHVPYQLKEYLDIVLTAGYKKLYYSDGRKAENPAINYGTGGLLQGKKYLVTTTWNAPETAFTLPGEFFQEKSVDDGILFPFHRMNAFIGLEPEASVHFHDVEKNMSSERLEAFKEKYLQRLEELF